jgi:phosphohistidine phosphatase
MRERARVLVVMRHAKAVREAGLADEERPLTGRGRRDAALAGEWLRQQGLIPDLVLCSPAVRTMHTWEHVRDALGVAGGGGGPVVDYDRRLYWAGGDGLPGVVRETGADVRVLLLVGHNPAAHQLALGLTGQCGSFPAAAVAVIALPGGWAAAAPGAGDLIAFWSPGGQQKNLRSWPGAGGG